MTVIALSALASRVEISLAGNRTDEAAEAIRTSWSWCVEEPSRLPEPADARLRFVLDDDPEAGVADEPADVASASLRVLMHWLSQKVTLACIDQQVGRLLMMHACALADPGSGRAIAAVAPSGTGKTTFVRTLGRGRTYLSDETVGLREDRVIVPHPKPLSIATGGADGHADGYKDQVAPATFGLLEPTRECRLQALWFLERTEKPVEPRLESVDTLEALTTMAPQMSYLSSTPHPLQRLAATVEAVGGLHVVTYHEASDLEPFVAQALEWGR